ncbi:Golgin imh1, partial [Cryomyces antarcticus]
MADELRAAKSSVQSSRSSLDSTRVNSPAPAKSRNGSLATMAGAPGAEPAAPVDYVYLKNVLLQFLEQRDKRLQMQLVPVLGMLLHFDRKDEQKWMAAITA